MRYPLFFNLFFFHGSLHLLILNPLWFDTLEDAEQEVFVILKGLEHILVLIDLALLVLDLDVKLADLSFGLSSLFSSLFCLLHLFLSLHVVILDELDQALTILFKGGRRVLQGDAFSFLLFLEILDFSVDRIV